MNLKKFTLMAMTALLFFACENKSNLNVIGGVGNSSEIVTLSSSSQEPSSSLVTVSSVQVGNSSQILVSSSAVILPSSSSAVVIQGPQNVVSIFQDQPIGQNIINYLSYSGDEIIGQWGTIIQEPRAASPAPEGNNVLYVNYTSGGGIFFKMASPMNLSQFINGYLKFMIKGSSAGSAVIKLEEGANTSSEKSLASYVTLNGNWQEVSIPLKDFSPLGFTQTDVLFGLHNGSGEIFLDNIRWESGANIAISSSQVVVSSSSAITSVGSASIVRVNGYQLMVQKRNVNGTLSPEQAYTVKGVGWSPAPKGYNPSWGGGYKAKYDDYEDIDIPLMSAAHVNTVRLYDSFARSATGTVTLDKLYAAGIMVIMQVFTSPSVYESGEYLNVVEYFKDHPAILGWMIGNELNYNKLYSNSSLAQCITMVKSAATAIKGIDKNHPVIVGWGDNPTSGEVNQMPEVDVFGINVYRYLDINSLFTDYKSRSSKPMIITEYGADAWNNNSNSLDENAQSYALQMLTNQIKSNWSSTNAGKVAVGGVVFEWVDEWWKYANGDVSTHDHGGFSVTVHPDGFANEEWWGILDIDRNPRQAYNMLKSLYQ